MDGNCPMNKMNKSVTAYINFSYLDSSISEEKKQPFHFIDFTWRQVSNRISDV